MPVEFVLLGWSKRSLWEKATQKMGHECELAVIRSINRTGTSSLNGNEREHSFPVRKP